MSDYFNLNKSVNVNTPDHLDRWFEVSNDTERDTLITDKRVSEGHILYHKGDNKHYALKSYDGSGNVANATWIELGNGSGGADFDKELFFFSNDAVVGNGEVGNKEKPFRHISEIYSLLLDNENVKTFIFLNGNYDTDEVNLPLLHYRFINLSGSTYLDNSVVGDLYNSAQSTTLKDNNKAIFLDFRCKGGLSFEDVEIKYSSEKLNLKIECDWLYVSSSYWLSGCEGINIKCDRAEFVDGLYASNMPFVMRKKSSIDFKYVYMYGALFKEAVVNAFINNSYPKIPRLTITIGDVYSDGYVQIHDKTNCYIDVHFKGKIADPDGNGTQYLVDATSNEITSTPKGLVSWYMYNTTFDGDFALKGVADIYGNLTIINNLVGDGVFTAVTGLDNGLRFFNGTLQYGGQNDIFKSHHKKTYEFSSYSVTYNGSNGSIFSKSTTNPYEVPFAQFWGNCVFNHQGTNKRILYDALINTNAYCGIKGNLGGNVILENSNGGSDITVYSNGLSKADVTDKGLSVEDENGIEQFKVDKNEAIRFVGATFPNNGLKEVAFGGGGGGSYDGLPNFWYVNLSDGDDTLGNGTLSKPFKTIEKVFLTELTQSFPKMIVTSNTFQEIAISTFHTRAGAYIYSDLNLRISTAYAPNSTQLKQLHSYPLMGTVSSNLYIDEGADTTNLILNAFKKRVHLSSAWHNIYFHDCPFVLIRFNSYNDTTSDMGGIYIRNCEEVKFYITNSGNSTRKYGLVDIEANSFRLESNSTVKQEFSYSYTETEFYTRMRIKCEVFSNSMTSDIFFPARINGVRYQDAIQDATKGFIHGAEFNGFEMSSSRGYGFNVYRNCFIGLDVKRDNTNIFIGTHAFNNNGNIDLVKNFTDLIGRDYARGLANTFFGTQTDNHISTLKFSGLAFIDSKVFTSGKKLIKVNEIGVAEDYNLVCFLGSNVVDTGLSNTWTTTLVDIDNLTTNDRIARFIGNNYVRGQIKTNVWADIINQDDNNFFIRNGAEPLL